MKLILPVIGVRGDVQIFMALAKELQGAGHEVLVVTRERFQSLAEMYEIPFYSLGGGDDDGSRELQEVMNAKSVLASAKVGLAFFFEALKEHTETLQKLFPGYDAVIGYGSFGQAEADKLGVPFFSITIDPSMAEKWFTWNPMQNLALFMEKAALKMLMGKELKAFRASIEAPELIENSPRKIILPMSALVVPPASNWSDKNSISGFWYLPNPNGFIPSQEILTFLDAGEKPLFITFGSAGWTENDNDAVISLIANALEATGERAVILIQGAYDASLVPGSLFIVKEIPYSWILDRVSAVVLHCGMGTSAEVLRAGIPAIPVPYMIDQFQWAQRLVKAGIATKPIDRKKLTLEKLVAEIKEMKSNERYRMNAKALGEKIRAERGLSETVKQIEDEMSQNR